MKYPTVSALCEGVAGAIREKEGSTALINPQDFPERIKGLEVGGGGSKMRYFKVVSPLPSAGGGDKAIYSLMSQLTRSEGDGKVFIHSGCFNTEVRGMQVIAYGVDLSTKLVNTLNDSVEIKTLGESLAGLYDDPSYFEEITEEQFYDLNTLLTPQEITFTVSGVEYTALSGMTWEEFCNSEYNIGGQDWMSDDLRFECDGDTIYAYKGDLSSGRVENATPTDIIIANTAYSINS